VAELEVGALLLDTGELLDMMAAEDVETKLLEMDGGTGGRVARSTWAFVGNCSPRDCGGCQGVTQNMVLTSIDQIYLL